MAQPTKPGMQVTNSSRMLFAIKTLVRIFLRPSHTYSAWSIFNCFLFYELHIPVDDRFFNIRRCATVLVNLSESCHWRERDVIAFFNGTGGHLGAINNRSTQLVFIVSSRSLESKFLNSILVIGSKMALNIDKIVFLVKSISSLFYVWKSFYCTLHKTMYVFPLSSALFYLWYSILTIIYQTIYFLTTFDIPLAETHWLVLCKTYVFWKPIVTIHNAVQ